MRLLVASTTWILLLAGCAALVPEDVDDAPPVPHVRPDAADVPEILSLPWEEVNTTAPIATSEVAHHDSYHGDYFLVATPDGLHCGIAAGPDPDALAYTNVCSLVRDGRLLAQNVSHEREGDHLLLPGVPEGPFEWRVDVYMEVPSGNNTGWILHDSMISAQEVQPALEDKDAPQGTMLACEGDPLTFDVAASGEHGRAVFELELGIQEVMGVSTDALWSLVDGVLRIETTWSPQPGFEAEVVLAPKSSEMLSSAMVSPCGLLTVGPETVEMPYSLGIEGIDGTSFAGVDGNVELEIWRSIV